MPRALPVRGTRARRRPRPPYPAAAPARSSRQRRRASLERTNFADVAFAWAGSTRRGEAHYYRSQAPGFLVEYDNTQNGANHIHTVWRDFDGDFGRDLLREHHRGAGRSHGH